MPIYRGVSGVNREVSKQYRGVEGINREVSKQYRGVEGINREVFSYNVNYLNVYKLNGGSENLNLINSGRYFENYSSSIAFSYQSNGISLAGSATRVASSGVTTVDPIDVTNYNTLTFKFTQVAKSEKSVELAIALVSDRFAVVPNSSAIIEVITDLTLDVQQTKTLDISNLQGNLYPVIILAIQANGSSIEDVRVSEIYFE